MLRELKIIAVIAALAIPVLAVEHAPLPAKILQAKTAYIENRSTDAKLADRAYEELTKWGRFQMVDDPDKADIILRLSTKRRTAGHTTTTDGRSRSRSATTKITTVDTIRTLSLSVVNARNHRSLWSDSKQNDLFPVPKDLTKALIDELRDRIAEQEAPQKPPAKP